MSLKPASLSRAVFQRIEGTRIAYYHPLIYSDSSFWDSHWDGSSDGPGLSYYLPYNSGYIGHGVLASVFKKFLPKVGKILEAGCGRAQHVIALRALGYDCLGIDFASKTVARVKTLFPDLPVEHGDILSLPYASNSLAAYISLGVVEHFSAGPQAAIREARRVLAPNGTIILSVPQAFASRAEQASPAETPVPSGYTFYQYAFACDEIANILRLEGFAIIARHGYESHYSLITKYPWLKSIFSRFSGLKRLDLILDRTVFGRKMGRMVLFVAKKGKTADA